MVNIAEWVAYVVTRNSLAIGELKHTPETYGPFNRSLTCRAKVTTSCWRLADLYVCFVKVETARSRVKGTASVAVEQPSEFCFRERGRRTNQSVMRGHDETPEAGRIHPACLQQL